MFTPLWNLEDFVSLFQSWFNLKLGLTVLKDGFFKSISNNYPAHSVSG